MRHADVIGHCLWWRLLVLEECLLVHEPILCATFRAMSTHKEKAATSFKVRPKAIINMEEKHESGDCILPQVSAVQQTYAAAHTVCKMCRLAIANLFVVELFGVRGFLGFASRSLPMAVMV